jgi:N-acetylmuramoyl-L-alanine amidase
VALALGLAALAVLPALAQRGGGVIVVSNADGRPAEKLTPVPIGPTDYLSTNDLARVFGATKFWRPELRKLTLRLGDHTLRLTADAPLVVVDEQPRNLVEPPRMVRGVLYVPARILDRLGEWRLIENALWDSQARRIHFRGAVHTVRQVQLWAREHVTEVNATLLGSVPARLLYATPRELRVLLEGGSLDTARVFAGGLVTSGAVREVPEGVEIRLLLHEDAKGYQISSGASRVKVSVTREKDLIEAGVYTKLEPARIGDGEGRVRVVVIDPGHGDKDLGATLPGAAFEKDLVLDASRVLRAALQQRLDARVLLTRDTDTEVPLARRAEIANEAGAQLFISVHADAEGAIRNGGFRIYAASPGARSGGGLLPVPLGGAVDGPQLRPWTGAQASEAGSSMALGQAIADALARNYPGLPVSFRPARVGVLEPVLCPAILIEIAPPPRSAPEAHSLQGYTLQDVAQTVVQTIREVARGEGG